MKLLKFFLLCLSLLTIIILGINATSAWFTDEVIIDSYTSTGTLEITLTGGAYEGVKLEPGLSRYTPLSIFCIRNQGDYNLKWKGWMEDVVDEKNLQNYLSIELISNPAESDGNYGPKNVTLFTDKPFSILEGPNPYFLVDNPDDPFKPGDVICYEIRGKLSSQAPNEIQNAQISARFFVFATQQINTGWNE
jgi:hypothetical protein